MKNTIVPCNSLAAFDSEPMTGPDSPLQNSGFSPLKNTKKARMSEPDVKIIQNAMSVERRKTLMCTEQSNFQVLQNIKLPGKKYGALCPTEYQKFVIKNLKIKTKAEEGVRYEYPRDHTQCKAVKRKGQSITCSII